MHFIFTLSSAKMASAAEWEDVLKQLDLTTKPADIESIAVHVKDVQIFPH